MNNIYLIIFSSELNKSSSLRGSHETLFSEIEKYFTLHLIDYKELSSIPDNECKLVFIATGGVERLVAQQFEKLPYPMTMLTDGIQNSLAASLEISTWIRNKGMKAHIIHGDIQIVIGQIHLYYNNFIAMKSLQGKRIGVIGNSSAWLIASNVDYLLAKRRWGVEYTDLPLEKIYQVYETITDNEIGVSASAFASGALACREAKPEDLLAAMRLYRAIKKICEEEKLSALTLSCFLILEQLKTTGCLALSLLNNEGIIAGCEGDLQSIFTLLTVKAITGQIGFMANPFMINEPTNEVVLAHCTVSTKLAEHYIIRNHFESEIGIAIQGILPTGVITLVKCGGECLDEYFVSTGVLTENTNYVNACRTQVRVRLDRPVTYFLRNPLGNHHILIPGNYEKELNEFFQSNSCKRME